MSKKDKNNNKDEEGVVVTTNRKKEYKTWSSGLKISEAKIVLMDAVEEIIFATQEANGKDEISIMFKGQFGDSAFYVSPEYYIPLQEKATHSVDYHIGFKTEEERTEKLKECEEAGMHVSTFDKDSKYYIKENMHKLREDAGYNTIVHSHPFSVKPQFSGADDIYVNNHFPCSLLSDSDGIVCVGSLLFKLEDGKTTIKLPVSSSKISRWSSIPPIEIEGLDKIQEKLIYTPPVKVAQHSFHKTNVHNSHDGYRGSKQDYTDGIQKYKVWSYQQALSAYEKAASDETITSYMEMSWLERHFLHDNLNTMWMLNDDSAFEYGKRKYKIYGLDTATKAYNEALLTRDKEQLEWLEKYYLKDETSAFAELIQGE